jgi:hypothetical protein
MKMEMDSKTEVESFQEIGMCDPFKTQMSI